MTEKQLNDAFDSVINKFVEESSNALQYSDDDHYLFSDALNEQNKAIEKVLISLKQILITDKRD